MRKGRLEKINALIEDNMWLVPANARNAFGHDGCFSDMESEAMQHAYLELVKCARRYKAKRGCSFRTFATTRIRGALTDWIRGQTCIRGYDNKRRTNTVRPKPRAISLSVAPDERENMAALDLPDSRQTPYDVAQEQDQARAIIRQAHGRERKILELILAGYTYKAIGQKIGVSESRVSQILRGMRERVKR